MTDRQKAEGLLERLRDSGYTDTQILEHILYNFMSGAEELEALQSTCDEFGNGGYVDLQDLDELVDCDSVIK